MVDVSSDPYYLRDLALVHHRGFAFHAANCAPGILQILAPVRQRHGTVLEFGCGSGLLTKELLAAGHEVLATDASPAMLEVARETLGEAASFQVLTLPDDPVPPADAIVGVGHPINYLADAAAIDRALVHLAAALRPGGCLAFDLCDLSWGTARQQVPNLGRTGPDWAIITEFSLPSPDRFVRDMTTFVLEDDGTWRRDQEHHENVLVDSARVVELLNDHGVRAERRSSFGDESLPEGLHVIVGEKPAD
jgi:SAM-dependent methyltransferase